MDNPSPRETAALPARLPGDESMDSTIRTRVAPDCHVCGTTGEPLYHGLTDRLFGASGAWNLRRCPNTGCGAIWPSPKPLPEDVGKAYAHYYTHETQARSSDGAGRWPWETMKRGYWRARYGYGGDLPARARIGGFLLRLFPSRRFEADTEVRWLRATPGGRLLDVGCGSGEWLAHMRDFGWTVQGVDFDAQAVAIARERGLDVQLGSLEAAGFSAGQFDAITLHHVIEHVPDPIKTLRECGRLLKPDGRLVLFTPNAASLSHRVFKQHWRGLEPPRHLLVFSPFAMERALTLAGFSQFSVRTFVATPVVYHSLLLWQGWSRPAKASLRHMFTWAAARAFKAVELCAMARDRSVGDCLMAIAQNK